MPISVSDLETTELDQEKRYRISLKHLCHSLIIEIFGDTKRGRAIAYSWLTQEFGYKLDDIHFKDISDIQTLEAIFGLLKLRKAQDQRIREHDPMTRAMLTKVNNREHKKRRIY